MKGQFMTDQGRVRNHNEDAGGVFQNDAGQYLSVIADGMGGHQAGDVASQMAITIIEQKWLETKEMKNPEELESWIQATIHHVNNEIFQKSTSNEACQGMGTTLVMTITTPDFFTIGHIGDSRIYMKSEKEFKQITEDHTLVNELVRSGQISLEDAEHHPRKNVILRALGTEQVINPDVLTLSWDVGDKLLLCSDGLSNKVSDSELQEFLKKEDDLEETTNGLIALANERGGEDNISLIIVHHDSLPKEGETSC